MKTYTNTQKTLLALGLAVLVALFSYPVMSLAGLITLDAPAVTANTFRTYEFFASSTAPSTVATTTSATSTDITSYFDSSGRLDNGYFVIAGAKEVTFYFSRGGATNPNTGTSRFEVEVSPDGSNWYDFNRLILNDVTGTGTTSVSIVAATSTTIAGMDLTKNSYYAVRCIVVEITDGEHRCRASAEY